MERKQEIVQILLHILLGSGLCILLGYFFYGPLIFRRGLALGQFVTYGLVGSIFYTFLKYWGMRTAWISLGASLIAALILAKVSTPLRIVPFVIGFTVIGFCMIIYQRYIVRRFSYIKVGKFIALSLLLAVSSTIAHMIYGWIVQPADFGDLLRFMFKAWLLMGAGLGLGFEFAELIFPPDKTKMESKDV